MSVLFVLRDDDLCAYTRADELYAIYGDLIDAGVRVTFAAVPYIDPTGNRFCDGRGSEIAPLHANQELCALLSEWQSKGAAEMALHGITHRDDGPPEFQQKTPP